MAYMYILVLILRHSFDSKSSSFHSPFSLVLWFTPKHILCLFSFKASMRSRLSVPFTITSPVREYSMKTVYFLLFVRSFVHPSVRIGFLCLIMTLSSSIVFRLLLTNGTNRPIEHRYPSTSEWVNGIYQNSKCYWSKHTHTIHLHVCEVRRCDIPWNENIRRYISQKHERCRSDFCCYKYLLNT